MMELSKIIPERKKVVKFDWCKENFTIMSDRYRKIRDKFSNKMTSCFWCKHVFLNGESIALAHIVKGKNVVLCVDCVKELNREE